MRNWRKWFGGEWRFVLFWLGQLPRRSGQIGIYFIFVLLAFALWYLTKLSQEYTVDLRHEVQLENHPPGNQLVGAPTREVWLRIRGRGYTLLKYRSLTGTPSLFVDLREEKRLFHQEGAGRGVMSRLQMEALFSPQLSSGLTLEAVLTDSLVCRFSPLASKKVPVVSRVRFRPAPQFVQMGRELVIPDSVWVSGPLAEVDSMRFVMTESIDLGELYDTYLHTVRIVPPGGALELGRESVRVNIPVVEFTEKRMEVEVHMAGLPDSLSASLFPKTVCVTCNVPLASYLALQPKDFHLVCRYSEFKDQDEYVVELDSVPPGVFSVSIEPRRVGAVMSSRF